MNNKKRTMAYFDFIPFENPYPVNEKYKKKVAYFSMEFGIDQALKIYSGGLGFLAGSHMRSAYELKQNIIGIGVLWKYGYYDQARKSDGRMDVLFLEKDYHFLEDTGIKFQIRVNNHPVWVKAYYLNPETFKTAPLFLLSTDLPENDYLAQSITHHLYDSDTAAKIAQYLLLGIGGARLLDIIGYDPEYIHLNEAHGLPAAFHLYKKYDSKEEVRKRLVFTTHTPEEAGNEKHDIRLLHEMGYFGGLSLEKAREVSGIDGDVFNHSLVALRFAKLANAVSRLHRKVAGKMWEGFKDICPIISITNAQNRNYWADTILYKALDNDDSKALKERKQKLKQEAFQVVADQTGKIFDPEILTLVWARRFAPYKRPKLLVEDLDRFEKMLSNVEYPIQIIWAGKPYPMDYDAISIFNSLVQLSSAYKNCTVLTGYELSLSKKLKQAADVWLNTPRLLHEASGTSGMTAAMNGAVNFSTNDGWIPEFIKHGVNGFLIPPVDPGLAVYEQDSHDLLHLFSLLENEIIPLYYSNDTKWQQIVMQGMQDVFVQFDSDRMAREYYEKLYQ